ncbi:MAG: 50S ribosomal protein L6 [Candidatus Altimarinota bacterium]
MSRIGKLPVVLAPKVEAKILDNVIEVSGPLGTLKAEIHELVSVSIEDGKVTVTPKDLENPLSKALWGTTRANINNMVEGVSVGYTKSLEINGVGYKMEVSGTKLILSIGFSHKVEVEVPKAITMKADEKLKNTVHFSSSDKQLLGEFVSKIRAKKKPEPYKGKGIKYVGEVIRRKAGKSGK